MASSCSYGSSPLARGTPEQPHAQPRPERFIPAGAGNTSRLRTSASRPSVHPRWRGEHRSRVFYARGKCGSSPLARGTLIPVPADLALQRFIPAGAGNTHAWWCRSPRSAVHPRWRGEHRTQRYIKPMRSGSSPLARGTHPLERFELGNDRFIPAGAGNTCAPCLGT